MTKRVAIYTRPDGGVSVVHFAAEALEQFSLAELIARSVPAGVDVQVVDVDQLPAGREWRDAWRQQGAGVDVAIEPARVIAHQRRRAIRAAQFAPHDEVIAKQIPGVDLAAEEAARAAIRACNAEAQTLIDAAASVADLSAALQLAEEGA